MNIVRPIKYKMAYSTGNESSHAPIDIEFTKLILHYIKNVM